MPRKKSIAKKLIDKEQLTKKFGSRLKELREKRNLSGEELGEIIGLNRQAIPGFL